MKSREVPPAAIVGLVVVAILAIVAVTYMTVLKPVPQVDPSTISAERLLDPDKPHGSNRRD